MLAHIQTLGVSVMSIAGIGLIAYCVISILILWAYARTRLYPLYLLKICWVGFTFVGFVWIISMSFADPGPKHGGMRSEFTDNAAGPFAALGDYTLWARRLYASTPWWIFMLFGLLLLWRGLAGHGRADEDAAGRRTFTKAFLRWSAVALVVALAATDRFDQAVRSLAGGLVRPFEPWWITGTAYFAGGCILWALLPLRLKRRCGGLALVILGLLAAVPLAVALAKFNWDAYTYAASNYTFAWKTARMGSYMLNSVMVSVLTVGITSVCASMAAYVLARFDFVGRTAVLFGFIGAMVIPAQLYIVPLFLMVQNWHIATAGIHFSFMDSRLGLSLIYAAAGLPFAIFLLTGFYRTLPGSLREAAAIDGCGEWRIFTHVYVPLAAPGMATAAIFQFLGVWNEYQFALVFLTNDKLKTLPVGLYNLSVSQQYAANWSALFAGVTILCLPTFLIFVILQERIVAGLTVGAVKE